MSKRKRPNATRSAEPKDSIVDLARRLRRFREAAGLTQETLARQAQLTGKFISAIENGHVNPSIDVVTRLVEDGLRMPLSAFFADDGGDVTGDLEQLTSLFGGQTATTRRRALRVLRALCDE
ncbi:MAG TPA: helix-turn-helix transcriptional regulator [Kofleriaceae bacterium]